MALVERAAKKIGLKTLLAGVRRALMGVVQVVAGRASRQDLVKAIREVCDELCGELEAVEEDRALSEHVKRVTLGIDAIKALLPNPAGNTFYPVEGHKKLNVQVTPNGAKSFIIRYRINKKQKIHTICKVGEFDLSDVVKKYNNAINMIIDGIDPNAMGGCKCDDSVKKEDSKQYVSDLIIKYKKDHVLGSKTSWKNESTRLIDKYISVKDFIELEIRSVTKEHILTVLLPLSSTKTQYNTVRSILRTMFRMAEEWNMRDSGTNPVIGVSRKKTNKPRKRRLNEFEIVSLGNALREMKESLVVEAAIKLYLMTGMRKSELIGDKVDGIEALTWDRVDKKSNVLLVYAKNGDGELGTRHVYCGKTVMDILDSIPKQKDNPFVIHGKNDGEAFVGIQKAWERIRVNSGFSVKGKKSYDDPTIHDLRRTFASVGKDLGYDDVMGELLGHSEKDVTDIYTRSSDFELFFAADDISDRIKKLLDGEIDVSKEREDRLSARRKENDKNSENGKSEVVV